jgi:hypothetical protein
MMGIIYWNYLSLQCYFRLIEIDARISAVSFAASKNWKEREKYVSRSEVPVPPWRQPQQNES